MTKPDLYKIAAVLLLCAAIVTAAPAQVTFTTLVNFDFTDGASPQGALIQATDGNLYGTTAGGGSRRDGSVFKMTLAGVLTELFGFRGFCSGGEPMAGLVQGSDGNFYGTTYMAEGCNSGTVFKMTPEGTLTTLGLFCAKTNLCGSDGAYPRATLIQASDGNFYGTTWQGGAYNQGTVFRVTAAGSLTTLYSFCAQTNCTDGSFPLGALVQASNGNFYGTTETGGANPLCSNCGTVFELTLDGTLTTLYSFGGTDGLSPRSGLIEGSDQNFYGTTSSGGHGYGTIFRITPTGTLTTLYRFCSQKNCTDGVAPFAGLVQGTDNNLYGVTYDGGANKGGTIFQLTPGGVLTTLHAFDGTDGARPFGGLVQATNGIFYGTTSTGGTQNFRCGYGCGTIFSLDVGLRPH